MKGESENGLRALHTARPPTVGFIGGCDDDVGDEVVVADGGGRLRPDRILPELRLLCLGFDVLTTRPRENDGFVC